VLPNELLMFREALCGVVQAPTWAAGRAEGVRGASAPDPAGYEGPATVLGIWAFVRNVRITVSDQFQSFLSRVVRFGRDTSE